MLLVLRGVLALAVFAGTLVLVVYLLGLNKLRVIEAWPGIESPSFRLTPGETGSWVPDWPARPDYAEYSELLLVPTSLLREPGSVAVQVVAEHGKDDEFVTLHGEWIGAPTEWMSKGVGQLPAPDNRPLLVRENLVTRITWKVLEVDAALAGSSARLVLSADERRSESYSPFKRRPHFAFLLILFFLIGAAVVVGTGIHLVARGDVAHLVALRAALAATIFAMTWLVGVYLLCLGKLDRAQEWPGIASPAFHLTQGQSGDWHPQWPKRPRNRWGGTELRLESNSSTRRPEALEVLVGVDPLVRASHGNEWLRPRTEWMRRGIGTLPVHSASRPLLLDDSLATRISWRVTRVDESLAGSTARIVLGSPPDIVDNVSGMRAHLRKVLLPVLGLLAFMTFGIGCLIQERASDRVRARSRELLHRRPPVTSGNSY